MSALAGISSPPATENEASKASEKGLLLSDKKSSAKASTTSSTSKKRHAPESSVKASEQESSQQSIRPNPFPLLCGFEDDGSKWTKWEGPERIKATRATADEQKRLNGIIASILHEDTLIGRRLDFDPDDVAFVMTGVREYFRSEPVLIEDLPFGLTIVGDLHGKLLDLDRAFAVHDKDGARGWMRARYLFLGDYVDRGRQSLEVIMLLFCLKILYPDNLIILRGNHEFFTINRKEGFGDEIFDRYDQPVASMVYGMCNEAFSWLSVAAIVGNFYFCAHGGISPVKFTRYDLRATYKPIVRSQDDPTIHDILWSDPAMGLRGAVFNHGRGTSCYFGLDVLIDALHNMGCKHLVRGHTKCNSGYAYTWGNCLTVFSATCSGKGSENAGSVAVMDTQGNIEMQLLEPDLEFEDWTRDALAAQQIEQPADDLTEDPNSEIVDFSKIKN